MAITDLEGAKITSSEMTENSIVGTTGSTTKYTGQASAVKAMFDKFSNFITGKHNDLVDFLGGGYREIKTQNLTPTKYLTFTVAGSKDFRVNKCGKHCTLDINARWAGADNNVTGKTMYTVGTLPSGYRPKNDVYFVLGIKQIVNYISVLGKVTTAGEVQIAQEDNTPTNLLIVGTVSYFTEE